MSFCVIGCSHREATVEFRQKLAFSPKETEDFIHAFSERFSGIEIVLLSTCNRTELYLATELDSPIPLEQTLQFLAENRNLSPALLTSVCFHYSNREAVEHLFNVAASLDSMALGDVQIISQVRRAYNYSAENDGVGPLLNQAFQTAVKIARRIDTETEIHHHRTSIASIAVKDFAQNIFESFVDKQALVIGAGEMAEETLEYLKEDGIKKIAVVNRTLEKAQDLANKKGGVAKAWEELDSELQNADLVISAVGGSEAIVSEERFRDSLPLRKKRPLFILDLGVPRNFDPKIGKYSAVYLYSIDDLEQTCLKNRQARERQLPKAQRIIQEETEKFIHTIIHRQSAPILSKLRGDWESIMDSELKRLFNKRPQFTEEDQQAIEQSFERLVNKILHSPYEALRAASQDGVPRSLLDSIVKLFRLK